MSIVYLYNMIKACKCWHSSAEMQNSLSICVNKQDFNLCSFKWLLSMKIRATLWGFNLRRKKHVSITCLGQKWQGQKGHVSECLDSTRKFGFRFQDGGFQAWQRTAHDKPRHASSRKPWESGKGPLGSLPWSKQKVHNVDMIINQQAKTRQSLVDVLFWHTSNSSKTAVLGGTKEHPDIPRTLLL